TAIADGARARVFYELLAEIVSECGLRPYLPHHTTDPIAAPDLDPRSVYEIDRARVARSGLVIAYAGTPSFGVGIEVEIAREHGIPVIIVAERDRTVSRILLGSPAVVDVVRFTDLAALRHSLGEAIARVAQTSRRSSFTTSSSDPSPTSLARSAPIHGPCAARWSKPGSSYSSPLTRTSRS